MNFGMPHPLAQANSSPHPTSSNWKHLETQVDTSTKIFLKPCPSWKKASTHAPFLASVWHHETAEHHIDQIPRAWDHMMKGKEGRAHQRAKEEHLGPLPQIQWVGLSHEVKWSSLGEIWRGGMYYMYFPYLLEETLKKKPAPFRMAIWARKVIWSLQKAGRTLLRFPFPDLVLINDLLSSTGSLSFSTSVFNLVLLRFFCQANQLFCIFFLNLLFQG